MWKERRSSVLTVIFANFIPEMLVENINDSAKFTWKGSYFCVSDSIGSVLFYFPSFGLAAP
jgi:hypothetical protein